MLVQVWTNFLIEALIVISVSLVLICNQRAHQNQADHARRHGIHVSAGCNRLLITARSESKALVGPFVDPGGWGKQCRQ